MFEAAELGQTVTKAEFKRRVPIIREALLMTQYRLQEADFPVILLIGGVDGAGKGVVENALNTWMDPRWMVTHAFDQPTQEERERPSYWRYWKALPARGQTALMLSAWYSEPLLNRAYGGPSEDLELAIDEIVGFERLLTEDKTLILKVWLHLGKAEQKKRFKRLEGDELLSWQVTDTDWKHWHMYDSFVLAAERIIARTSTGAAPWHIIEGVDSCYAALKVAELLLRSVETHLDIPVRTKQPRQAQGCQDGKRAEAQNEATEAASIDPRTILATLDMSRKLTKKSYNKRLALYQGRLHELQRRAVERGIPSILLFEGWDSAGKGGAIRRINAAVNSRTVTVIPVGPPTDEEAAHHYLWRFWRHIPRDGRMTIFDRSWYGRVLVERVHKFAAESQWQRAYGEINLFEQQLTEHGILILKFFLHITPEEQLQRFRDREDTPYKRWKISDEDWRNRALWNDYDLAIHDMVERTSTNYARWNLVEANDKRHARIKVLQHICTMLEQRIEDADATIGKRSRNSKNRKKKKGRKR